MNNFVSRLVLVLALIGFSSNSNAFNFFQVPGASSLFGTPELPNNLHCLDTQKQAMPFNNQSVMSWRTGTPSQYHNRGFVQGTVSNIYPRKVNAQGFTHTHFAVNIDQAGAGDVEIIFNDEFGPLPNIALGMNVVACGDYITADATSALPSPMGAIIHWVHYNPGNRDGGAHPDGFVIVNNAPFGFTKPPSDSL